MPRFLVTRSVDELRPEDCFIISAKDHESALQFMTEIEANDQLFLEHLADRSVNMGFAAHFWLQDDEAEEFNQTGEVSTTNDEFIERVQEFFADHPEWARLLTDYVFGERDFSTADVAAAFPFEMRVFIAQNSNWNDPQILNLDDVRVLA